jgi:hypothetical protein
VNEPLPLAAASERLRGKPGRPPLSDEEKTKRAKQADERKARKATALAAMTPRLMDLRTSERYSSLSTWTLRTLIENGTLRRVVVPMGPDRDVRRILLDRADLDRLIESWKAPA